jgi:hypothetical protein
VYVNSLGREGTSQKEKVPKERNSQQKWPSSIVEYSAHPEAKSLPRKKGSSSKAKEEVAIYLPL